MLVRDYDTDGEGQSCQMYGLMDKPVYVVNKLLLNFFYINLLFVFFVFF